jgi:catechol 2,3-dioxygenase-like lactoylglutathione lyase family enzyme
MPDSEMRVRRIAGFGVTSFDADRLAEFYQRAFHARAVSSEHLQGPAFERLMRIRGAARRQNLQLGEEPVDILQFDIPGKPYSDAVSPYDMSFQHFAIVVSDMAAAISHLRSVAGWTPISTNGPQRLPQRSGGVTAFKFQDPDGHPLELLEFGEHAIPPHWQERSRQGIFLGIDHSAISVRDTGVSAAFYRSIGLNVTAQTYNHGTEQARLDGILGPHVEVTAMSAQRSTPHLELLCYRSRAHRPPLDVASNGVAATRIRFAADDPDKKSTIRSQRFITDPDGHHLFVET